MPRRQRIVLFALAAATLSGLALLLAFADGRRAAPSVPSEPEARQAVRPVLNPRERQRGRSLLSAAAAADEGEPGGQARPAPQIPAAKAAARRFLAAFLRYEVGDLSPRVIRALRRRCVPGFAAELLSAPPRPSAGSPRSVPRSIAIAVEFTDRLGERALVTGTTDRGNRAEPFSFRLGAAVGGWRVVGVGP